MSRLLAILLILALPAYAQDGGAQILDVETAEISNDAGIFSVNGGCWLSTGKCIDTAKELKRLRAENESLRSQPQPVVAIQGNLGWWILGSACLGFVGGALFVLATQPSK